MKSSTLRRANLSKEKIQVLEALAKYRRQTVNSNVPQSQHQAQVPQIKERELDMLWNNFKQHTKQDKSPTVYLITGFIAGAVVMLIITTLLSLSMKSMNESAADITTKAADTKIEDTAITFIPADKDEFNAQPISTSTSKATASATSSQETYTVQSGDTLESIIIRFYGSYSVTHEKAIKEANHMANPNALQIGQKLIIPLH